MDEYKWKYIIGIDRVHTYVSVISGSVSGCGIFSETT